MALAPHTTGISGSVGRSGANRRNDVLTVQGLINAHLPTPLRPLNVDGHCGLLTIAAIEEIQRRNLGVRQPDGRVDPNGATFRFLTRGGSAGAASAAASPSATSAASTPKIAWGAKVSPAFKEKAIKVAASLGINPDFLMSAMAFESGESFSPSKKNGAGSGATGLIQFMPSTASSLGTSTPALAGMSAEDQLDYVQKYFKPHTNQLHTIEDVYMAILWPAAIGKPNSYVLFSKPSTAYNQNAGLDSNHDGKITKEEAAAKVKAKLQKGKGPGYLG